MLSFFIVSLIIATTDGVIGITVDVNPKNFTVLRVGQSFTFKCSVAKPLLYCRIKLPGDPGGLNLNEYVPRGFDYWYEGEGLASGQCGITIARITDRLNGKFECSLGTQAIDEEILGSTNVTVAKAPIGRPDLKIVPRPKPGSETYAEDQVIKAVCTVGHARPAATITWYIGEDQIKDGLEIPQIIETSNDFYTVSQSLDRKLSWKDSGKELICVANHPALDNNPRRTSQRINIVFAPRRKERAIEKVRLLLGQDNDVTVQVQANPRPSIYWVVNNENIRERQTDSTERFMVGQTQHLGNSTYETTLTIKATSAEDVKKTYSVRAENSIGGRTYTVLLSTAAQLKRSVTDEKCPSISEECLSCLCEASSDCDFNYYCDQEGLCGPFKLSNPFWKDGGMHTSRNNGFQNEETWQVCTQDPECAAETVRDYMKKYCKDCNGDGRVDCYDFALIHQKGGPSCDKGPLSDTFKNALDTCLTEIMQYE